jgi:adenosylmethionine-8-amino-7-oxononanoate aminotransferase
MTVDWLERDRATCWHPYTQHGIDTTLLPVVGAQGAWLELADGRKLLDGISSWWSILHGHGDPRITQAIAHQAQELDHVLFAGCTHKPAVDVAETLIELARPLASDGVPPLTRVFYSDNGSTAIEVALKAAYQTWLRRGEGQRKLFIALEGSYHGDTVGAMSVSEPAPFFQEFGPLLFEVKRVRPEAEALETMLKEHAGQVAGLIVEPLVQGAAGMVMYPAQFLKDARRLCDEHGAFLIADEVFTGFGRTGTVFACEQAGIRPDLLCLAKGLTGGVLPLAATMATEEIFEAFLSEDRTKTFFHGHTFTANPIACAAAVASLKILKEERTPSKLTHIGNHIIEALTPLRDEDYVVDLRQLGGIVALELGSQDRGYLSTIGDRYRSAIEKHNVLLRPSGNVLYAVPPACTSPEEAQHIGQVMRDIATEVGRS